MDKKQAQQEILRRLGIYMKQFNLNLTEILLNSRIKLLEYHSGELSKQELIKMITVDENGNFLSEPETYQFWLVHYSMAPSYAEREGFEDQSICLKYQQAFNQATEIVNFYDGE